MIACDNKTTFMMDDYELRGLCFCDTQALVEGLHSISHASFCVSVDRLVVRNRLDTIYIDSRDTGEIDDLLQRQVSRLDDVFSISLSFHFRLHEVSAPFILSLFLDEMGHRIETIVFLDYILKNAEEPERAVQDIGFITLEICHSLRAEYLFLVSEDTRDISCLKSCILAVHSLNSNHSIINRLRENGCPIVVDAAKKLFIVWPQPIPSMLCGNNVPDAVLKLLRSMA